MYGVGDSESEAISRDMNSYLFSSTFKHSSEGEFAKNRELTSSDLYHYHPHQQQQQSSGLMRNRSAPSSYFASLLDGSGNGGKHYLNPQSSIPESETIFMGFVSGDGSGESDSRDLLQYPTSMKHETISGFVSGESDSRDPLQHPTSMKHETIESVLEQEDYSATSRMVYSTAPARDLPNHSSLSTCTSTESSFGVMDSMAMENLNKVKSASGNCSNLIRQSSSPAGFFSNLASENGFAVMRDVVNFRANNKIGVEASSSTMGLSNHMNFSSSRPSSSSRFIPEIDEKGNENIPNDSWNDSTFTTLKRNRDGDLKMLSCLNGLDTKNGDSSHYSAGLAHHLSLPKTSAEMAAVENYLHFQQDTVPCKIRAKRGFATHPRSIAERVRRTRISQRMRKLQELFPDMDKQANIADMLDLAVEFIKDLQKEVQTLKETRAKCTCSIKQKPSPPTA